MASGQWDGREVQAVRSLAWRTTCCDGTHCSLHLERSLGVPRSRQLHGAGKQKSLLMS
jgi:polyribonucleotide nucleotidyltransferase